VTESDFRPWTSRVRSPSPAFRFIDLQAYRFWKYSKYSVKGMMRRISALLPDNPRCKSSYLSARFGRVFVTSSLGMVNYGTGMTFRSFRICDPLDMSIGTAEAA
jgi:hypothetical protein